MPVFQRDYAWTEEQCTKLFEDIVMAYKKDRPHFCGSFVYAPLGSKKHIDSYIIIDGQQRFTTLYILIKALADSADDDRDKDALQRYLYNEDKFDRYGLDEKSKLKLKPVKTDNDQLLLLMSGKIEQMDKSRRGIIYHNYMLFMQLIKSFLEESSANSVLMINDGIEKLICADIRLDTDDNAQEIFERINSTGIKLGLADLIRNYILMTDTDQERLYEEYWLTVQNLLPDKLLDNFFIDYLNMKSDGFVKESEAYKSFKQVYVEGKYDNEKMLQEILHYAKQYYVFCYGSSDFGAEVNKALAGLRKLKQTTVYLFLFRVFDDYENGIINKNELARVLKMLLSYSIRRLVCEIGSNTLRGLYKTLYGRVFEQKENKNTYYDSLVSFFLQQTSKNTIPSDNEFVTALQEKNLYSKNALCKYLLCAIENQGKETLDTENLSIEHIMPQNKNLSMSWQKMLGENWQSVHEKYLHTLGNLTLTGYNSELGDKPFEKKKEKLEETITHIAVLYSDVKDKSEWNSVNMEKRAKRLAEIILKLFPIEQPKIKIEFTDPRYKLYTLANPDDATYKTVNYFEFLGERVNVSSFAEMVRSIAQILYDMDNSIIDDMAKKHEPLPEWTTPAFSYEEDGVRNPFKLRNCNIYISTGYSASACIFFIRGLMKKYEFDISEDFVYSAKPNNTSIN
ncbi:DUF262 domain-containing protein [Phascolarctobacterium succinatutens]|uniref:DUF262 domain-containing protein n=1 Tax=Phascolarctobacterium succinatutens TaxID=626940 RepID=UPI003079733D